ncbi:MAG: vitamin B12-dependent ribonucleotide reductase [Verrucomicrobia bacterium]|nr:vitamin B12-dependent ribonucleotide reductase [Verrucomicrobiota bacterium]
MIEAKTAIPMTRKAQHPRAGGSKKTERPAKHSSGLTVKRVFSTAGKHPFDQLEWEKRTAEITDDTGKAIFKQENVEVPKNWSVLATKVVVSKYFYGELGTPERETSAKQLIHRVTRTIADWGLKDGYFKTQQDAETFYEELTWLSVNQHGAFNSPVWFNVGLYHQYGIGKDSCPGNWHYNPTTGEAQRAPTQYEFPQGSACFIQSVRDNMEDIMRLAASEAMLFKFGSGTGTDLSTLRSSREKLSGGGRPSGPLSFLKVYDQIANVVKSGGNTRRAAKMNILKDWHPDILEFIECKTKEEKKAWALIEQGYEGNYNGDAYGSIMYQNENLSVRASDEFMQAAVEDRDWHTHYVTDPKKPGPTYKAKELLRKIAEGTHICGDPGMQYGGTIHRWHTCKNTEAINATNPCSEYVFIDNTACNLASLNLMKFRRADGTFEVERFRAAVRTYIIAQEILVDNASYPTKQISENSHIFRTLGLGYANLGSLLMAEGLSYDSNEGRALCGAITAIMTGAAYEASAELAAAEGPFPGYLDARCAHVPNPIAKDNRECMLDVIRLHRAHVAESDTSCPRYLRDEAQRAWDRALALGEKHGYRNAQVTVLAPTGTIAFMMDCDTTGIEPEIALVKYKLLAGGGMLKIVNRIVPMALEKLGYSEEQIKDIVEFIDQSDTIEGAPHLKEEHFAVFDCAFKAQKGNRSLHYMAHLRMMAAAQPFISGAISKTVNMPETATIDDVMNTYIEGWKLGLKAVAIYRDGSKRSAPLSTRKSGEPDEAAASAVLKPFRRRMPETRMAITHKFDIAGHEGYLHVGLFEDGTPGELFITMAKEGSTIGGLMDSIGTLTSMALQYGVPMDTLVRKFAHQRFEPSGLTKNPDIRFAASITDYVFRWLGCQFIPGFREETNPQRGQTELPMKELQEAIKKKLNRPVPELPLAEEPVVNTAAPARKANGNGGPKTLSESVAHMMKDAPVCPKCGHLVVRNGACFKCLNCGESLGCS